MFKPFYIHSFIKSAYHPGHKKPRGITFKVVPGAEEKTADIYYAVASKKETNYSRPKGREVCDSGKHCVTGVPLYRVDRVMAQLKCEHIYGRADAAEVAVHYQHEFTGVLRKFV
jgi:hypothetical protein